jgi:hypothetical protein
MDFLLSVFAFSTEVRAPRVSHTATGARASATAAGRDRSSDATPTPIAVPSVFVRFDARVCRRPRTTFVSALR